MKTAIYIEDGVVQLVLTPEGGFEEDALKSFADKPLGVQVFRGQFYDCQGGWVRQKEQYASAWDNNADRSLILRIEEPTRKAEDA